MKIFTVLISLIMIAAADPLSIQRGLDPIVFTPDRELHNGNIVRKANKALISDPPLDDDSMKRGVGEIVETRQAALAVAVVFVALVGIEAALITWLTDDAKRHQFTINTVTKCSQQWPAYNWVVSHSPYSTAFDGTDGVDWGHTHYELKISLGRTIGYDTYWAGSGTFTRYGDGGYTNWAYEGNVIGTDGDGSIVHFSSQ